MTRDEINQILGGTGRSAGSLKLGDVATGLADVADGVAVLGLQSGAIIRRVGRDLIAWHLSSVIREGGNTLGLNIDVATGLNAELILIHSVADEAGLRHVGIDLDGGLVAGLVAGIDGVGLTDDNLVAGAKSAIFGGDETEKRLGSTGRDAGPVDGVDVAALVSDVGDGVAVLDGLGATVLRSLGGDILALDGRSIRHGNLARGGDL